MGGDPASVPSHVAASADERVRTDGKFFRCNGARFTVKGVTYGPFAPDLTGSTFAEPDQTARDFDIIRELGANVVRTYYPPPEWLLDLAAQKELKVLVDIPWEKHLCFLDLKENRTRARRAVREAVQAARQHPAVFAFSVVNEIPADIVRWSGVQRVERFIEDLVAEAKDVDAGCLCTFASFPPTEYLNPEGIDFVCFNVYLHERRFFESYLARLQTLAGSRPLVLGEFGMDSLREGEEGKCEFLEWQIEGAFRAGLAGTVLFSYTDDWFRGGMQITDWAFGVTTRDRRRKDSFQVVQEQYGVAPYFPLARTPRVSVVVATYNGERTLEPCLASLQRLNYRDFEVIVVDDGSTDATPEIVARFPAVRYLRQENRGLSAARNAGILAATGDIVAFTDDDCRVDEDWLYHIVNGLQRGAFAGIGGHNFLPPEDSPVAAAVLASPGGPAHVLLTDREAEHIPGCNMAFYRRALLQVGLFDPVYRKAGDDVDICWRMQNCGWKIGFSAAGFVWHYRRPTVRAYLKQQAGYGEAEALLMMRHPERFNSVGGGIWRGRIYSQGNTGLLLRGDVIYHGIFGSGFFQRLYAPEPVQPLMFCTLLSYHVCITIPLAILAFYFRPFVPLALSAFGLSLGVCALAASQAELPRHKHRVWSRPLIAMLFFLQPIVRGWARFKWRFNLMSVGRHAPVQPSAPARSGLLVFWSDGSANRYQLLSAIIGRLNESKWTCRTDRGWSDFDVEVIADLWTRLRLTTVAEELEMGRTTVRCRIERSWSIAARLLFSSACAVVLALVWILSAAEPWVWLLLVAVPLLGWCFDDSGAADEEQLGALVLAAASDLKFVMVPTPAEEQRTRKARLPGQLEASRAQ